MVDALLSGQGEETLNRGIQIHIGHTMPHGLRLAILLSGYTNKINMKVGYHPHSLSIGQTVCRLKKGS